MLASIVAITISIRRQGKCTKQYNITEQLTITQQSVCWGLLLDTNAHHVSAFNIYSLVHMQANLALD